MGEWTTEIYRGYLIAQHPGSGAAWIIAPEADVEPVSRPDAEQAKDCVDEYLAW